MNITLVFQKKQIKIFPCLYKTYSYTKLILNELSFQVDLYDVKVYMILCSKILLQFDHLLNHAHKHPKNFLSATQRFIRLNIL